MVKKGCAKGAQQVTLESIQFASIKYTNLLHGYPDKFSITNLLRGGLSTQLKGGYKE
jgi:hypothetical protein